MPSNLSVTKYYTIDLLKDLREFSNSVVCSNSPASLAGQWNTNTNTNKQTNKQCLVYSHFQASRVCDFLVSWVGCISYTFQLATLASKKGLGLSL